MSWRSALWPPWHSFPNCKQPVFTPGPSDLVGLISPTLLQGWAHNLHLANQHFLSSWPRWLPLGWECNPSQANETQSWNFYWRYWERGSPFELRVASYVAEVSLELPRTTTWWEPAWEWRRAREERLAWDLWTYGPMDAIGAYEPSHTWTHQVYLWIFQLHKPRNSIVILKPVRIEFLSFFSAGSILNALKREILFLSSLDKMKTTPPALFFLSSLAEASPALSAKGIMDYSSASQADTVMTPSPTMTSGLRDFSWNGRQLWAEAFYGKDSAFLLLCWLRLSMEISLHRFKQLDISCDIKPASYYISHQHDSSIHFPKARISFIYSLHSLGTRLVTVSSCSVNHTADEKERLKFCRN